MKSKRLVQKLTSPLSWAARGVGDFLKGLNDPKLMEDAEDARAWNIRAHKRGRGFSEERPRR